MTDSRARNEDSGVHPSLDFIRRAIVADLESGKHKEIVTRFPPEPNGFLHIGHAKSIVLNFGIAAEYGGRCLLRFDDTNPTKEDLAYIRAIEEDVRWLGFDCAAGVTFASDYFDALYACAEELICLGKAYVCSLSAAQIRAWRGTLTAPGRDSPYRDRPDSESLDLLRRMRTGEYADGEHVLRARMDMSSANINLRDPIIYRIRHARHPRTGDRWHIYPTYDYAQCLCDALQGVTHSLCTLEFEDHRPLYDWFLDQLAGHIPDPRPRQIEFSRLELEGVVLSKRLLRALIADRHVAGWDDPRLATIAGLRRRGVPAAAIRDLCARVGVTKKRHRIELGSLEHSVREGLEDSAPRAFAVLDPVRLVIVNYPEAQEEMLSAPWHPKRPELGRREIPFARELFIEREDFALSPARGYKRFSPGADVRLRHAYILHCEDVEAGPDGRTETLYCSYYPDSRSGQDRSGVKARGVVHWISAGRAIGAEVRLYDRLCTRPDPGQSVEEIRASLNPESLLIRPRALLEPALGQALRGSSWQFERLGYFCRDPGLTADGRPIFNRTVTLRDGWRQRQL